MSLNTNSQDFESLVLAIRLVLAKWATLNYAIDNEWADSDSLMMKRLMENDLLGNIQERWNGVNNNYEMYQDEIADFLLQEMDNTFNCSLEDGSDKEIAEIIHRFYYSSKGGDMSIVNGFIQENSNLIDRVNAYLQATSNYVEYENGCEEEEMDPADYEEVDPNLNENPKNEPDEDGWTIVK